MNICVIPARGGSKRIPRKNIKNFCGQPLIAYSIASALDSKLFDHVIVSTDDHEIAEISLKYGASVPFTRPESLSDDYSTSLDVVEHALSWVQKNIGSVKLVCTLYATAPFTNSKDLINAYEEILKHKNCQAVYPIVEFDFPIQRAIKLANNGSVEMFQPKHLLTRSQDLEKAYHDAGQFYWMKSEFIGSSTPIFSDIARTIKIPHYRVQDIDTNDDWIRAEFIFKAMNAS